MSILTSLPRRSGFSLASLPPGVLVFAHELRGAGTVGGVADGARVSAWSDQGPAADPLTSSGTDRPIYRAARNGGRPVLEFDVNDAEMRFLAGAVNRTVTHVLTVASFCKPPVTRDASQNGPSPFDGYRGVVALNGYDGLYPGGQASVILTGNSGLNVFFDAYAASTWRADGVAGSPAAMSPGYERTTHLWEISRAGTFSGYPLVVGRDRNFTAAGNRWRGYVQATIGLNNPGPTDLANVELYLAWYMQGPVVAFAGDSLTAGFGVLTTQNHAALLHASSFGTLNTPNLAIPGQGLSVSTYGPGPTLLSTDPAKLAALAAFHPTSTRILSVWAGTNDLALGRSPAQIIADLWTYCDQARSNGWSVIVSPLIDRTDRGAGQAAFDADRATINAAIDSQWPSHASALLSLPSSLTANGSANNLALFNPDKVHLTSLAYSSLLFPALQASLAPLLPPLRSPHPQAPHSPQPLQRFDTPLAPHPHLRVPRSLPTTLKLAN